MASRKNFLSKSSYIFRSSSESDSHFNPKSTEGVVEFEEADVWNLSSEGEAKKGGSKRGSRKVVEAGGTSRVASTSFPVNIPDWSKILKEDYKEHQQIEDGDHNDEEGIRIPPHEYLARTRGASLSVHEGRGRTLKGRDLRSVRNAIWKKVGFED